MVFLCFGWLVMKCLMVMIIDVRLFFMFVVLCL